MTENTYSKFKTSFEGQVPLKCNICMLSGHEIEKSPWILKSYNKCCITHFYEQSIEVEYYTATKINPFTLERELEKKNITIQVKNIKMIRI